MISLGECQFVRVTQKVKKAKMKGYGATFISLRGCSGGYKEGVNPNQRVKVNNF